MALDGWKERLFRQYLYWLCRPARLRRRLAGLIEESRVAPPVEDRFLRVAALQVKITLFKDPLDYALAMHRRVAEATAAGGAAGRLSRKQQSFTSRDAARSRGDRGDRLR